MKKSQRHKIDSLWLYRYRFVIGYSVLALLFAAIVIILPFLTPGGLSEAERQSAVASYNTHFESLITGDFVDLPYRILQKLSITVFGLSVFTIKLPSIILGLLLGLLLILLLNRWFKSNVALLASIITVFSAPFLYLAGSGTPLIMLVFWPTLLLWLGSKIQHKTSPVFSFIFVFALLFSIFTPHLIYLAIFICIFAILNPHLRFTLKKLPKIPAITALLIVLGGLALFILGLTNHPATITVLFFTEDFSLSNFFNNIAAGFAPFFSWNSTVESTFLSPLVGLATTALALVGLFSTAKGFFASRNAIASCFIVFSIVLAGFNPDSAILILLPLAILTAHGLRYILEKWYDLFPENPYARIFAILPISIFLGIVIISDLSHFIFGYRYTPVVANQFNNDLNLVRTNLDQNDTLLVADSSLDQAFYQILAEQGKLKITADPTSITTSYATLGKWEVAVPGASISQIITSPKSDNSDRIYIYNLASAN